MTSDTNFQKPFHARIVEVSDDLPDLEQWSVIVDLAGDGIAVVQDACHAKIIAGLLNALPIDLEYPNGPGRRIRPV